MVTLGTKTAAFDLELPGSVGNFNIGQDENLNVNVKYFLTHVGLKFSNNSTNDRLLRHLAPVREIFNSEELDFDQIMQRDIDDSRVTGELIPYLLDKQKRDFVKLFPPIIVNVLPISSKDNLPIKKYPKVITEPNVKDGPNSYQTITSGELGNEVFSFWQPEEGNQILCHDLTRLKLNTNKCRLIIVDGQHRAMALLALYRNLKNDWSDAQKAPYKSFYEEWTPNFISKFDISNINLPIMFCVFPTIDDDYVGEMDVLKASRSIFLTLNKTAKKVSQSRNLLLDDNDLVAFFMRKSLAEVKNKDMKEQGGFYLWNIELDQDGDKKKIENPMAITGVSHFYYFIEDLLFCKEPEIVCSIKSRNGNYRNRTDLTSYGASKRLDAINVISSDAMNQTKRNSFVEKNASLLNDNFQKHFGNFIIRIFEEFTPYLSHNLASYKLNLKLRGEAPEQHALLFKGQGMLKVFKEYIKSFNDRINDPDRFYYQKDSAHINLLQETLKSKNTGLTNYLNGFKIERAKQYCKFYKGDDDCTKKLLANIDNLFSNVYETIAFQTAIISGFFRQIESCKELEETYLDLSFIEDNFNEYIKLLNNFFAPNTEAKWKKLFKVFLGDVGEDWEIIPNNYTFRSIVMSGEMKPDEWPKYSYLISEIWRSENPDLKCCLEKNRKMCRIEVFESFTRRRTKLFAAENNKLEINLTLDENLKICNDAYDIYKAFLQNLGVTIIPTLKDLQGDVTT